MPAPLFRRAVAVTAGLAMAVGTVVALAPSASANPAGTAVVISEAYVNGGSAGATYANKFVELYNPTGSAVGLGGDSLQYRAATSTGLASGVFALAGTIAAHGHLLIQLPSNGANGAALPTPDLIASGSVNPANAGGTLFLAGGTAAVSPSDPAVIDKIGWGTSNSPEGAVATGNSVILSYQRDAAGTDTDDNAADFGAATPTPQNAAGDGGTQPADIAVANPGTQHAATGAAIVPLTLTASGGTAPYTWTATGLPDGLALSSGGVISGTPTAVGISSVTATATDATRATGAATFSFQVTAPAAVVSIAQIQGTNVDTSPYAGQSVTTEGVVTADYRTGGFNGFYLQTGGSGGDPADDQTPGASDAVFVFGAASAAAVTIGESVQVTGKVSEYQGATEITGPTVTPLDTALPAVKPGVIPWSDLATDAQKEAHEGELIEPQGDFTVSDNYDANYYGSFTLAAGDTPLRQPTDVGTAGSAQAQAVVADNASRMITLDDGASINFSGGSNAGIPLPWLTPTNPVSIGAQVSFHAPVILEYRFNLWNFQPTAQVTDDGSQVATFSDTRARNARPADVGGDVRLATFNVENYFAMTGEAYVAAGLGTCTYYDDRQGNHIGDNRCVGTDGSPGPRGAATAASFARQQAKIVTGINRLGASIVSLEEIENSVKFGEDRDSALAGLVAALNAAAGSGTWAYVPSPAATNLPPLSEQDVIRTAFIYRPAAVSPVGASRVLTGDSGDGQPFSIAREPLAQAFKKVGARDSDAFLVIANHLKSKGADADPLFTDCPGGDTENTDPASDQGAFNCTRVHQVQDLIAFANRTAAAVGTDRIFLLGDFNAYTHEDPMQELAAAGYTDLGSSFDPTESTYSYNGLEGSLDHVVANAAALGMVTGADVWQINAQEAVAYAYSRYNYNATMLFDGSDPFAASDHDPVVVGLNLPSAPDWSAAAVYRAGDQVYYRGSTWQALWWTQNQAPGDVNGPWQQILTTVDGTAVWTPSRVFTTGELVEFDGSIWRAQWYTRNQQPGDVNGPWEEIRTAPDGTAIWTPTRVFTTGDVVLYLPDGRRYVAQWHNRDQPPGPARGPWKPMG